MDAKNKFICQKCNKQLPVWSIFKSGFGSNSVKSIKCKECNDENKYHELVLLRYLPAIYAGLFIFIEKSILSLALYFGIFILLIFLYYYTYRRVE